MCCVGLGLGGGKAFTNRMAAAAAVVGEVAADQQVARLVMGHRSSDEGHCWR